ncbi:MULTISPECIES: glycosyltransferase [unclassified Knoellia]|uniref:glycosyltransferase n=1 Tax=Knoellia altitudinis TaxID=3404795 RepID=UPI003606C47C
MKVGWYVHHHGAGHRTRATVVGGELAARGADVTLLGSALDRDAARAASLRTVLLAMDAPLASVGSESGSDVTVHGMMHWAPLWHSGFRERMTTIARWVQVEEPDVFVVDVSCEVAVMVRLLGVPVVIVAQPGDRRDPAHSAALDAASAVLAPWPSWATEQIWRRREGPDTATSTQDPPPVVAVGGITRRAAAARLVRSPDACRETSRQRPRGLMLTGSEGFDDPALPDAIASAVPEIDWTVAGGGTWLPNVQQHLAASDIVVTHAGQNAIADVAGLRVPAVVVPQSRPFDEQAHMGEVLRRSGIAHVVQREDVEGADWAELVRRARADGGESWERWGCQGAAERAASLVEVVAGA